MHMRTFFNFQGDVCGLVYPAKIFFRCCCNGPTCLQFCLSRDFFWKLIKLSILVEFLSGRVQPNTRLFPNTARKGCVCPI